MEAKPTKKGISYYWNVPTWARKRGAPFANEALGSDYADAKRRCRPNDAPDIARIFHHKTGELVEIPLYDEDGTELWPELVHRLDNLPRYGTLIVTRETVDRKRKVRLPWGHDHFRHRVKELKDQLGWVPR